MNLLLIVILTIIRSDSAYICATYSIMAMSSVLSPSSPSSSSAAASGLLGAKKWHDNEVSLDPLKDQTIAVIGYGIQGRAQASNIKDS